jgi:hypothetical protein
VCGCDFYASCVKVFKLSVKLEILYMYVCMLLHVNLYALCVIDVVSWMYFRWSFLCLMS